MISLIFNAIFIITIIILVYYLFTTLQNLKSYDENENIQDFLKCNKNEKNIFLASGEQEKNSCIKFEEYKKSMLTPQNKEIIDCVSQNKIYNTIMYDPRNKSIIKLDKGCQLLTNSYLLLVNY